MPQLPLPDYRRLQLLLPSGEKAHYRDAAAAAFIHPTLPGKWDALRNFILLTWPQFTREIVVSKDGKPTYKLSTDWNPWLERNLKAFCNETHVVRRGNSRFRFIGLTGCAAAGKSHCIGLYAVAWWSCSPHNSIAVLTSTTVGMIRHRIWPVVAGYANSAFDFNNGLQMPLGHLVDSQLELRAHKGDAKHAVFALAVAHGETAKAIHNLKGMHANRMLLVVDEANGTPEAILEIVGNFRSGAQDVTVIVVGNPCTRMDPHGRAIAPAKGWAVAADDKVIEWESKGVPEWELEPGLVLRFDGRDSPNVKLGKDRFPYLFTVGDWQAACDLFEKTGGNFTYWTQKRGLHPPEGFAFTVFNEQLLQRCDAIDSHFTFDLAREQGAFLDPAFTSGGDSCVLQYGEMGEVKGIPCLQFTDWEEIPIDPAAAAQDVDWQIAKFVIERCKQRNIKPEFFGLDATGTGRGVGAIIADQWSKSIQYTQWGLGATERPSAQNDGRPAREVYRDFVTEMWFSLREATEAGQVRGFSREAASQLCSRMWSLGAKQHAKKYCLEPKSDMKLRLRYSPDNADAAVGLLEVFRRNGLAIGGITATTPNQTWESMVRRAQEDGVIPTEDVVGAGQDGGWAEQPVVTTGGWD